MAHRKDKLAEAVIHREETLRSARSDLDSMYQSIARYVIPRKAVFTEEVSRGVERNRFVLDSTAPRSLELFASFLHSTMNNPAIQWFKVKVKSSPKLNDVTEVKQWLEVVEKTMLDLMSGQDANVYPHLHQVYLDLGAFGTAVLLVEVVNGIFRIRSYHLGDCVIEENEAGFVDTLFRRLQRTKRQANQRFGDVPLGEMIDKVKPREANREFPFIHAVFPMSDEDLSDLLPKRIRNLGASHASVWVNVLDRKVVGAGTFDEFPYMVPRWYKVKGDAYGRSPAMTVMADIRMANRMKSTILRGAEKLVDPPLLLPDGGLVSPIRLYPGGISFSEGTVKPEALIPPGASRIEVGDALLKDTQRGIREGFFVQLFISEDTPVKTATQVLQEQGERNRAVSPMLINTQGELFHPFVNRSYNVMSRNGLFPPPPAVLDNEELTVEYVSPLVSSQLEMDGLATLRLFENLAPWADIDKGVFDRYDPDKVSEVVHTASGAPASIVRTETEIKRFRKAREEREAQQEATAAGTQVTESAAKLIAATRQQRKGP